MKVLTKFHGEIELNEEDILTFQRGIPGFIDEKQFTCLALEETPFFVLQSVNTKEVAFIVINPFDVFPTYEVDLAGDVIEDLLIESEQDVTVFVIITIREPFEDSTANLQGPVILNFNNKLGKQYIMNTNQYTTQHRFIQSPAQEKQEAK